MTLLLLLVTGGWLPAEAQEPERPEPTGPPTVLTPDELTWQDGPMGREIAVLHGDPSERGPFEVIPIER